MKRLFTNCKVVNVFTDALEIENVLVEDGMIAGVGDYTPADADEVEDLGGAVLCPGFIDGHIHIESSMLRPVEFARACLPHGTTSVVADPHEVANVSGLVGIAYMLEASAGLPLNIYFVIPSCVPATPHDEAGAVIGPDDVVAFYDHPRVLGLGEVMNYPGVIARDPEVMEKIERTRAVDLVVNGHAPLVSGRDLDRYISAGISDDHECSGIEEALERIRKGQWVMVRQGTAAQNLSDLADLFDEPYNRRCMLATDDKHPADLIKNGHIDHALRLAIQLGKDPICCIRMATLQPAQYFGLRNVGAIAPGYVADMLVLDDLGTMVVRDVWCKGAKVVDHGVVAEFDEPYANEDIWYRVRHSFDLDEVSERVFHVEPKPGLCRVIDIVPGQLITNEVLMELDFGNGNGVDADRDVVKLAVIERHHNTGHVGLGFLHGLGITSGAIASSVSHDSHNLIVAGTNEADMAVAANRVRDLGGGLVVADDGRVVAEMALPIGGLMCFDDAQGAAAKNEAVRRAARELGAKEGIEPFMNLAFISLPVIPNLKMTTRGLVDVNSQSLVDLFA